MAQNLNFILRLNEKPLEGFKNGCNMLCFAFNNIILTALGIVWILCGQNGSSCLGERIMEPLSYRLTVEMERKKALIGIYFGNRVGRTY